MTMFKRKSEGESIINRPTSMMFGDAMLSDQDPERNSWTCLNFQRLDSIFFWFGFRTSLPFVWPMLFVGTFLIPYFCFDHSDGYIFMGSILSGVFCVLALISFWQIRPWRRHPSILMIMICLISIVISCILVYNAAPRGGNREIDKSDVNVIQDSHFSASDRSPSCLLMSFFIQLTLLAREGWILTLSIDLLTSITNPFASYKSSLKQYHVYIWSFTILSAIILISTKSCQGEFLTNGTCWIRISGAESTCFWGFFMAWIITFYVNAAAVLAYAFSRVSKGLESTYETRYACVADTFRVVFLYFIYGMIIAVFFLVIYYSYKSGVTGERLYFLEHCFAYLIACRGFVDALIWFFSHGFVSERKGVVTNLAAVVATESTNPSPVGRRQSNRSSPLKTSFNRYPFTCAHGTESEEQMTEEKVVREGDIMESDDQVASGNAKGHGHLLTLTDIFLPDQSLRVLFTNIFFGKPADDQEGAGDVAATGGWLHDGDEESSIHPTRNVPKKRHLYVSTNPDNDKNTLTDALLVNSPYEETLGDYSRNYSLSQRQLATSDDDEIGPESVVSSTTRDTYDVDVSPQLNLTLRREVLSLVTRGIQESVTRMIERDSQLRYQLAGIGVTVLDERDYFQEVIDDEDYDNSNEEEEVDSESEGYESSSSTDRFESSVSDTSIHSLLSSQHSARSTGLIPAPSSALPSSLIAARRVQSIQRARPRPQEKDRNKSNHTSNSSNSKSKNSRQSDSNGQSSKSKSRGKRSGLSSGESECRNRNAAGEKVSSPFADLTAAHRAGVAPPQPSTESAVSSPSQHDAGGLMINKTEAGGQNKRSQRRVNHHSHRYQRSHHSSQHIPSNIHLTNVNHSFYYRSPTPGGDGGNANADNAAAMAASSSSSMSSSFASSPLHPQKSLSQYHPSPKDSVSPNKLKFPPSSDHQHLSTNLRAPGLQHSHFEGTVIQNLISIVGGQYYPGEYGVDNLNPASIVPSTSEQSHSYHHQKLHRRHHHHSTAGSAVVSSSSLHNSSRVSMNKASHSFGSFAPVTSQLQHPTEAAPNTPDGERETSSKRGLKPVPNVSKMVDEEQGEGATTRRTPDEEDEHQDDTQEALRHVSHDSQVSNASSQASNTSSHSTSSSVSNPTNAVLRHRKQSILNEFRPPAIVVFYFDEQRHRFRDFRPATFRQLRSLAGISEEDYLRFISQPAQERLSEGRSGAFFFICGAGELVVKTIAQSEAKTLLKILDQYRQHFVNNPESLIVRFLGLHSITLYGTEFYFVVMKNIFPPGQRLQERYDLKGSYIARHAKAANRPGSIASCRHCGAMFVIGQGLMEQNNYGGNDRKSSGLRSSGRRHSSGMNGGGGAANGPDATSSICPEMAGGHEPSVTLKDNDLTSKIRLHPEHALQVIDTLFNDSDALASMGLMDYSLLVGVQHVHYDLQESSQPQSQLVASSSSASSLSSYRSYPARVVIAPNQYYFGIIDILQTWDYTKRFENFVKVNVLGHPYDGISAIPPHEFKHRFQRKIASVIDHAALIREVTGSWQGKREVGNVYSLTSLPGNMSAIPHNWSNTTVSAATNNGSIVGGNNVGSGPKHKRVNNANEEKDNEDDTNDVVDGRDSMLLRESVTSRHSLIMSVDQGAAAAHYQPTTEPLLSVSPTTALRHLIADRNSFRE